MATKPITVYTFATDATFSSGPASTFPTKLVPGSFLQGFIPGDAINAEWVNYLFNITGQWLNDWLLAGSSVATVDAHLVETDANGEARVAALEVGGTAATVRPLEVRSNGSVTNTALFDSGVNGATTVEMTGNTSNGFGRILRAVNIGLDPCALFISGGGNAVDATGGGTGWGVSATGGAGGGGGGLFQGNGASGNAHGVQGIGAGSDGAGGLFSAPPASTRAPLEAARTAAGAVTRGTLALTPSGAPSAALDGDVWKRSGVASSGRGGLEWHDDDGAPGGGGGGKQRAWSTENGLGYGYAESLGDTLENAGTFTSKVALTLGVSASPGDPEGDWIVEFSGLARVENDLLTNDPRVEIRIDIGGLTVATFQVCGFQQLAMAQPWSYTRKITLSGGAATLEVFFRRIGTGSPDAYLSDCKIVARGAYE